jgi:hypothetical protein
MSHQRVTGQRAISVALFAFVLATIAPSVVHALHFMRGDTMPWSQLCSATGTKRVLFEQSAGESRSLASDADGQCAYCALHDHCATPLAVGIASALRVVAEHLPAPWQKSPTRSQSYWHPAHPRAPPTLA